MGDPETKQAAVIDPVLDYDHKSGKANVTSADAILAKAREEGFTITLVLETHVHADHLSGAPYIKLKTGAKVAIGERIKEVQKIFRPVFNAIDVSGEGSEFDILFKDGERFTIGNLEGEVIATPGHTPGLRLLPHRRCGLRRRHAVHAGLRHGPRRLPRRRCPHPLPLHPPPHGAAARNPAVHVP